MKKSGLGASWAFIVNHAALVFVWVSIRVTNDFHRLYNVYHDWESMFKVPPVVTWSFLSGCFLLALFLNPYWLNMKWGELKKGWKELKGGKTKKAN